MLPVVMYLAQSLTNMELLSLTVAPLQLGEFSNGGWQLDTFGRVCTIDCE